MTAIGQVVRRWSWHLAVGALAAGLALANGAEGIALACAALVLVILASCGAPVAGALTAACVLAGGVLGDARLSALDRPGQEIRDRGAVAIRAHLLTRPRASPFGSSAEIRVASGAHRGARLFLRVPRWALFGGAGRAPPGRELAVRGRLRPLDPDASPFAGHLRNRGIAGELLFDSGRLTGRRRGGIAGAVDGARARAARALEAGMPPAEAALARGMVLGEDEAIAAGTREDFRDAGLAHLLAVSGQNVMLLVALAMPLLALLGLGPRGRGVILLALVAAYVPLAGAGPSLQRAGVMGAAGIAAMTLSRPSSRSYALLLAAAATLALNPRVCADPGWQLSFAAVTGILVLGVPLSGGLVRAAGELATPRADGRGVGAALVRGFADGLAITIAATLATAPLLAYHFGSVSAASLPANLLALPAVAPAMWLGMVKAALGVAEPLLPGAGWLAGAIGPLATLPVGAIAWLAERFADAPLATVGLPLGSKPAVAGAYALLGVGLLASRAVARRGAGRLDELTARWRTRSRGQRAAVLTVLCAAAALACVRVLGSPAPPDALTVSFLDVGQGDATLIQHPDGSAVLFDGGPPEAQVARLLRRRGVSRLSLVVATHASRDHHGGLPEVLERVPVEAFADGGDGNADRAFRAVVAEARRAGARIVRAVAPSKLRAGSLTVTILSPSPRPPGPAPEDPNPRAVVALVSADGLDLLLSADAESEALLPLDLPDVDAIKVPHHGSADPGLSEALARLRPELAVIEVGPNTYGHPAPSTLTALARAGARVYRTDRHGTVLLSSEEGVLTVETER